MKTFGGLACPAPQRVKVRQLQGKRLRISVRDHALVTDRPVEDGGSDAGCTSGELLLMAIGSCATGSLRGYLEEQGIASRDLRVEVFFEPVVTPGARDRIVISLEAGGELRGYDPERIKAAVLSGGVTSRVKLGSEVEVRFVDGSN